MNAALPLALACTLACTKPDTRTPQPPQEPKPLAASAANLPELERARLEYLFEAAGLVAHGWPLLGADQTCLLLIAQTLQWVVNCDEAPGGFERTPLVFRGQPVFSHAGASFESGGEQRSTAEFLARTPAAAHVFGASNPQRAWPIRHPWLLLGTLEALRQFHPAFGPATTEHWLSVAVHEFVHIHQLRQPGFAPYAERIDAHQLNPASLAALYTSDTEFRARIVREHQQLAAAGMHALDSASARLALADWLRSYRKRSARIARRPDGAQLLQDERVFIYLEGVARFVESDFLVNVAQHPAKPIASDPQYHAFEAFVGRGYAASPNRQLDTEYYYAIGYHLCVLLERVDANWQRRVDTQPGWLIGIVEELLRH